MRLILGLMIGAAALIFGLASGALGILMGVGGALLGVGLAVLIPLSPFLLIGIGVWLLVRHANQRPAVR